MTKWDTVYVLETQCTICMFRLYVSYRGGSVEVAGWLGELRTGGATRLTDVVS